MKLTQRIIEAGRLLMGRNGNYQPLTALDRLALANKEAAKFSLTTKGNSKEWTNDIGTDYRYRERFNPLTGLTIESVVSMIEWYDRGIFSDFMLTMKRVERLDTDLMTLMDLRNGAITSQEWVIQTVNDETTGYNESMAQEQQNFLRERYEKIENLYAAIEWMALAAWRGFSVLQMQQFVDNYPTLLYGINHWFIVRDGMSGGWYLNPTAQNYGTDYGNFAGFEELDPKRHIIRSVDKPLSMMALVNFMRKNLANKDWDAFIELYGIPQCVLIGGRKEDQESAERISRAGGGWLPEGWQVSWNTEGKGTGEIYRNRLDWLTEQIVRAATGGLSKSWKLPTGLGTGPSDSQEDTFQVIIQRESRMISEVFQRQFDMPLLQAQFPNQPVMAYFKLQPKSHSDPQKVVADVNQLKAAGYTVNPEQVQEETGYEIELTPEPALPAPPNGQQAQEPEPEDEEQELEDVSNRIKSAWQADWEPIVSSIENALTATSKDEIINRLTPAMPDGNYTETALRDTALNRNVRAMLKNKASVEGILSNMRLQ